MPILIVGHALSTSPFTMIHSIPFIQFTCLTVFLFVLDPLLHTPCISSQNHILFAAHAHTIAACSAVIPMHLYLISLSQLLTWKSVSLTPLIHLTILISARWSATSVSFLTGQVPLPCNMLLRTQLLYNLPVIINDTSLLLSSGTNCLNLFQPILILASTAASTSPSTLSMSPR